VGYSWVVLVSQAPSSVLAGSSSCLEYSGSRRDVLVPSKKKKLIDKVWLAGCRRYLGDMENARQKRGDFQSGRTEYTHK
jgi:hypothetical protein